MAANPSNVVIDDEYEEYNYEEVRCGKGGKNRSKAEIEKNIKHDTCGHTRKIVNKFVNTEHNRREVKK